MAAVVICACGGGPETKSATCIPDPPPPEWVDRPVREDKLIAVGIARSKGGTGHARDKAVTDGRDKLARILRVKVKNMTDTFFREAELDGTGGRAESFSRSVGRQLSRHVLVGTRPEEFWTNHCTEEVAALVVLDTQKVAKLVQTASVEALRELEIVQEHANEALGELQEHVQREFEAPLRTEAEKKATTQGSSEAQTP